MFSDLSSNVILAKARAMYGNRIRHSDYDTLLNCKSVFEIASFLKNSTSYSKTLSDVNESLVHRGDLEFFIKDKLFTDLASLCRYEIASGDDFSKYVITKTEIEQILHSLRYLLSINKSSSKRNLPIFFTAHSKINFSAISNIKTYDEFLFALGNSPYKKLLSKIKISDENQINLSQIEQILYNYLYEILYEAIKKTSNKNAKKQLSDIFKIHINFSNFVRIIRSKRNNNKNLDYIILKHGTIPEKHISAMLNSSSEDEAFNIMKSIHQGYLLNRIEYNYLDQIPTAALFKKCNHEIHSSVNSSVVLLSYIFLIQNELNNIIKIIEGTRYKLPKDEISKLLIL